ncbi:MAG: aminotransferase class V-fold PLP-dependent enzyme [Candidatus Micrarchaeia archaeon]
MLLFTPGPVSVKKEVLAAQAQEMITHRGSQFQSIYKPLLQKIISLSNAAQAHVITGSGTAAIDANMQSALPKEGKALVISNGAFGDKLGEHAKLYYPSSIFIRQNDAKGWTLERAKPHIDKAAADGAKLFCMVHHETSPGILNKMSEICNYAKSKGMLTLVDGTSAFPAYTLNHQKDGVDFYSWASQKAAACPPGVSVVSHSEDAISAIESNPVRSIYLNLKAFRKNAAKFETPNTTAVSLVWALSKSFEIIDAEGINNFISRHEKFAKIARDEIQKMGFKLVVEPGFESSTVVAFYTQKNADLNKLLQSKYGVKLGGGHADWKDNSLRFCTMGDLDEAKIRQGLDALKKAKAELGI